MRRMVLLFVCAFACTAAGAQGVSRIREGLARADLVSGARIEVREEADAAAAVRNADHNPERTAMTVYGVSLFRDNSQSAGESARAVARQFAEAHPGIVVAVRYESPYFRVEAGRFVDRTDAVALCGRVLAQFPKAVVVQGEVLIEEIVALGKSPGVGAERPAAHGSSGGESPVAE